MLCSSPHPEKSIKDVLAMYGITYLLLLLYVTTFVQKSIGLPDLHSGYGFAIGNMAAFDVNDPEAVVSPGEL